MSGILKSESRKAVTILGKKPTNARPGNHISNRERAKYSTSIIAEIKQIANDTNLPDKSIEDITKNMMTDTKISATNSSTPAISRVRRPSILK